MQIWHCVVGSSLEITTRSSNLHFLVSVFLKNSWQFFYCFFFFWNDEFNYILSKKLKNLIWLIILNKMKLNLCFEKKNFYAVFDSSLSLSNTVFPSSFFKFGRRLRTINLQFSFFSLVFLSSGLPTNITSSNSGSSFCWIFFFFGFEQ